MRCWRNLDPPLPTVNSSVPFWIDLTFFSLYNKHFLPKDVFKSQRLKSYIVPTTFFHLTNP